MTADLAGFVFLYPEFPDGGWANLVHTACGLPVCQAKEEGTLTALNSAAAAHLRECAASGAGSALLPTAPGQALAAEILGLSSNGVLLQQGDPGRTYLAIKSEHGGLKGAVALDRAGLEHLHAAAGELLERTA